MDVKSYKRIVKRNLKKPNYFHNYLVAFLSGGILGALSQILFIFIKNTLFINSNNARSYVSLLIIFISSFLTAVGVFDNLICKYRSGLIIPTTGFAHSITSSGVDAKREGLIKGLGGSFFHLAGSVILYSVVVSFILVIVKVIFFA